MGLSRSLGVYEGSRNLRIHNQFDCCIWRVDFIKIRKNQDFIEAILAVGKHLRPTAFGGKLNKHLLIANQVWAGKSMPQNESGLSVRLAMIGTDG